jgi:two-component system NtrC family response regulator
MIAPIGRSQGLRKTSTEPRPKAGAQPATSPCLVLVGAANEGGGAAEERVIPLRRALELGRQPEREEGKRTLGLRDRFVSARHASIAVDDDGAVELTDLDSRNGTLVDGVRSTQARLAEGARLFLGGHVFVFRRLSDDARAAIAEEQAAPLGPVATASGPMALVLRRLRRLAPTREPILLRGETGTGKEVYARAVHQASKRKGAFVTVDCAALPGDLAATALFGRRSGGRRRRGGAGAVTETASFVEQAEGGTLFLDEGGELPAATQVRLLRLIEDGTFTPTGAGRARRADVRVVAATGGGAALLAPELEARLAGQSILFPPLRDRPEDIGALTRHFLGTADLALSSRAFFALCLHGWPRNVRELEKVIREALVFARGSSSIGIEHLPGAVTARIDPRPQGEAPRRRAPTRDELATLLRRRHGRIADVARDLDRGWPVVWRWIRRYRLETEDFRRG